MKCKYFENKLRRKCCSDHQFASLEQFVQMISKLIIISALVVTLALCINAEFGCIRDFCWKSCTNEDSSDVSDDDWCYTTRSEPYSRVYVRCEQKSACDSFWDCADRCLSESERRRKSSRRQKTFYGRR